MTKSQGFLATFRIDEELWGKFKDIAKDAQTNASALLIRYIQGVVSSGGVDNSPQSTPQYIDNSPKLSIQDVEKIIDEKINSSIQAMDNTHNQSIQNLEELIDSRILLSVLNGDIKEAIARSYSQATTNLNSTRDDFYSKVEELQKQLEELKSNIPAAVAVPPIPQSPITHEELPETTSPADVPNHLSPVTNQDIIEFLGIADIVNGAEYWQELIIDSGIDLKILDNATYLESKLNIKISKGYVIARFNSILEALGFKGDKVKPNKQVKTKEGKRQDVYIISQ